MTDDDIKRVLFEHTKLNPNQADDQVLLDAAVRAVRELLGPARAYAEYIDSDPCFQTSDEAEAFLAAYGPARPA